MSHLEFVFIELPRSANDTSTSLVDEWRARITEQILPKDQQRFSVVENKLQDLKPPHSHFDCIVSPANSYGLMDGGVDYYLSVAFSPPKDLMALTRCAQAAIKERYFGMAPPGTCTLAPLTPNLHQNAQFPNCWVLAVCPTMRIPAVVDWHHDLMYNTMWSLLVEIEHWNARVPLEERIHKVAMTGLATGIERVRKDLCAWQMILAIRHFLDAGSEEGKEKWARPDYPQWNDVVFPATQAEDMPTKKFGGA